MTSRMREKEREGKENKRGKAAKRAKLKGE